MSDNHTTETDAWSDLGPTQRSRLSEPQPKPSAKTIEIVGKLGLRYPPASSVDREAHAARVALLAEDCADLDVAWLEAAAREWAKTEPFMPRACELRERALRAGRVMRPDRILAAPLKPEPKRPALPPLTEDEIRQLSKPLIEIGVKVGEIGPALAQAILDERAGLPTQGAG